MGYRGHAGTRYHIDLAYTFKYEQVLTCGSSFRLLSSEACQ